MPDSSFARMEPAKRDALIAAAALEFAEQPFAQASLNRIIGACRMSKSSFYHVIDSKDELLSRVVSTLTEQALSQWSPPAPSEFDDDFWTTAQQVWRDALEAWPRSQALNLLWRIVYASPDNTAVQGLHTAVDSWLGQVLDMGRARGAIDTDCPRDLQVVAVTSMLRAFDEWTLSVADQESATLENLAAQQFRLLKRLLQP